MKTQFEQVRIPSRDMAMTRKAALALALALGVSGIACARKEGESPADAPQPEPQPEPEQDPEPEVEVPEKTEEPSAEPEPEPPTAIYADAKAHAIEALRERLEGMRDVLYVYRDFSDSENHFTQRLRYVGEETGAAHNLIEDWGENPHSGTTCIRCERGTAGLNWGCWMFMNGYVPAGMTDPVVSDESEESRGLDLTGATELRFYARGEKGGEAVDFFCAGFGRLGEELAAAHADTADECRRSVWLSTEWEEYAIPLDGMDLSEISCGFGYAVDDNENPDGDIVFYLDDIRFVGGVAAQREAPVLLRSYDTDQMVLKNAAYTYDNALAAMAFLAEGESELAACLLDAFVYAVEHDRFEPGRIRNAYAAGDIAPFRGWGEDAKLPGWYDMELSMWCESASQVGSNVGNTSYAVLALLHYVAQATAGDERAERYLATARTLMDWVIDTCGDGGDGFTAGYDGWPENGPGGATTYSYKSTEHNIDAFAAFSALHALTGEQRYQEAAESALRFVESMYDADGQLFFTGTTSDGVTPDPENVVLDAQVWSALALGDGYAPYEGALAQLDGMRTPEGAYRFHLENEPGFWCEGTAFTVLMHLLRGEDDEAAAALEALGDAQLEGGLFPAATADDHFTGIYLADGSPWTYGTDPHVAPTAWFVMTCDAFNPYTFS